MHVRGEGEGGTQSDFQVADLSTGTLDDDRFAGGK